MILGSNSPGYGVCESCDVAVVLALMDEPPCDTVWLDAEPNERGGYMLVRAENWNGFKVQDADDAPRFVVHVCKVRP